MQRSSAAAAAPLGAARATSVPPGPLQNTDAQGLQGQLRLRPVNVQCDQVLGK